MTKKPSSDLKNQDRSDEELMSLYKEGQFSAFETLYLRHSPRIYEYLNKKVSRDTSRDLLQDVFEKLHKSRDTYDSQYPLLPWLFAITRNCLTDYFKKSEMKIVTNAQSDFSFESLQSEDPVAPSDQISEALAVLPPQQRQIVELRYMQDWSFEKIAAEIKTSEENVRKIVSRSIMKIRESLSKPGSKK